MYARMGLEEVIYKNQGMISRYLGRMSDEAMFGVLLALYETQGREPLERIRKAISWVLEDGNIHP